MLIGYVRYMPGVADETAQLRLMADRGADKIFTERTGSHDTELKARRELLRYVREGDRVLVSDIRIIADGIGDFLEIMLQLEKRGVTFTAAEGFSTGSRESRVLMRALCAMAGMDAYGAVDRPRGEDAREQPDGDADGSRPQQPGITPPSGRIPRYGPGKRKKSGRRT